jgi:hypothetical protein
MPVSIVALANEHQHPLLDRTIRTLMLVQGHVVCRPDACKSIAAASSQQGCSWRPYSRRQPRHSHSVQQQLSFESAKAAPRGAPSWVCRASQQDEQQQQQQQQPPQQPEQRGTAASSLAKLDFLNVSRCAWHPAVAVQATLCHAGKVNKHLTHPPCPWRSLVGTPWYTVICIAELVVSWLLPWATQSIYMLVLCV